MFRTTSSDQRRLRIAGVGEHVSRETG